MADPFYRDLAPGEGDPFTEAFYAPSAPADDTDAAFAPFARAAERVSRTVRNREDRLGERQFDAWGPALERLLGKNYGEWATNPVAKLAKETLEPSPGRFQLFPERMLRSGLTAPRDAWTGDLQVMGPDGRPTEEAIERVMDTAGLAGLGPMPAATRGAVGAAGGRLVQPAAREISPMFYSAAEKAIEGLKMSKAPADQWLNTLRNAPGVKKEELEALAFGDLPKGPITKEQLLEHVRAHSVEPEVKVYGGREMNDAAIRAKAEEMAQEEYGYLNARERRGRSWEDLVDDLLPSAEEALRESGSLTRYHDYQLPGGENYQEHLLTLPVRTSPKAKEAEAITRRLNAGQFSSEAEARALRQQQDRFLREARQEEGQPYRSSHWDEPNVLLHLRMNDRTIPRPLTPEQTAAMQAWEAAQPGLDAVNQSILAKAREIQQAAGPLNKAREAAIQADLRAGRISIGEANRQLELGLPHPELIPLQEELGRLRAQEVALRSKLPKKPEPAMEKLLHLEEIQSDWHQEGRRKGYASERQKILDDVIAKEKTAIARTQLYGERDPRAIAARDEYFSASDHLTEFDREGAAVPDAPFKTSWPDLALKRAIRHAAENDYDAISWTPGAQQAERYDLSKQIDALYFMHNSDGTFDLRARQKGGGPTVDLGRSIAQEKLPDLVGKEMANKLVKEEKGKAGNFSGTDLKVGGKGMRAFYDKMLVDKMNALAKKWGRRVEYVELPSRDARTVYEAIKAPDGWEAKALLGSRRVGPFKTEAEANAWISKHGGKPGTKVPILRLPPEMKKAALAQGQPLFMRGLPFPVRRVDHDPFAEERQQ